MFERHIEETIEIASAPTEVWWQLINFKAYPEWNRFITYIEGIPEEGELLHVTLQPERLPAISIHPRVLVAEPERELRWIGRLGLPQVLDGEHAFLIKSVGTNHVRFTQSERFSGLFVPGAMALLEDDIRRGFEKMNMALRQRCEAAHATRETARAEEHESHRKG
ncbi:MAG: SRPBCC domain-containing protein [candidate division WS1 bacterium]|jgi:hypothetical protein|nr:SRPBCC domain-containing protein [candidate division WS1 bacterium]